MTGIGAAGGIATGLVLTGAVWLVGTVLIAWTGQSAYHRFQAMGGAYVPAGRLEEGLVPGLTLTEHMVLADQGDQLVINWNNAQSEVEQRISRYNVVGTPASKVDELSGGNQQRFIIGLLDTPLKLILLEHPTRGLDVTSANHIWELFAQRRKDGTAILFMSADLDELLERSDRIAVFSGGVLTGIVDAQTTSVDELGHLIGGQQHE
jgi:simple sugar transport system ATP-binding protein